MNGVSFALPPPIKFDPAMERLFSLCSSSEQERNVGEILDIVNAEAPNLLQGLASEYNKHPI